MPENQAEKQQVSVTEALNDAWGIMWKNFITIFLLMIAFLFIIVLTAALLGALLAILFPSILQSNWFHFLFQGTFGVVTTIAIANTTLKLADNQKIAFRDLFSKLPLFFHILAADILYIIVVLVGLICLIVPGIIFAIRFSLYDLYIVDQGCGPIQALEKSWETLKGFSWRWFGFAILRILINFLGLLCLVIGLLFTWPTTVIARALLYRKLSRLTAIVLPVSTP